jgi:hypothetical protein
LVHTPLTRSSDPQEKSRYIREHIEQLLINESHKDIIKTILEELFFIQVKNAFSSYALSNYVGVGGVYRVEKRLTHPECFPKYFLLRLPSGEIADQEIEEMIHTWNEAQESEVADIISHTLYQHRKQDRLLEFLNKMRIFRELLLQDRVPVLIRSLYQNSMLFSRVPAGLWHSEAYQAESLIFKLLEERADTSCIQPMLEEIVRRTPSIPFIVELVDTCHKQNNPNISEQIDLRMLRSLASKRLDQFYVKDNHDIFAEFPESDRIFILHQWGSDCRTFLSFIFNKIEIA